MELTKKALQVEFFDKELFEKYNILTSDGIKRRFLKSTQRRKQIEFMECYCLLESSELVNANIKLINVDINLINVDINSQSKVKESKVINTPYIPQGGNEISASENLEIGISDDSLLAKSSKESDLTNASSKPMRKTKRKSELTEAQKLAFEQFWSIWPNKVSRGQAEVTWAKIDVNDNLLKGIIAGVERSKKYDFRFREGSTYMPHPSTWLNNKGWLDEFNIVPITESKKSKFVNYDQPTRDYAELERLAHKRMIESARKQTAEIDWEKHGIH